MMAELMSNQHYYFAPPVPQEQQNQEWQPYYDQDSGMTYYYNNVTNQEGWSNPKKVCTEADMTFQDVDDFLVDMNYPRQDSAATDYQPNYQSVHRCNRCSTPMEVIDHNLCQKCYDEVNSYNSSDKDLEQFLDKCNGCFAWGRKVVEMNGYCKYCNLLLAKQAPLPRYKYDHNHVVEKPQQNEQFQLEKKQKQKQKELSTPFPPCLMCGGFGKNLLQPNGMCNYCNKIAAQNEFDRKWKKTCLKCKGFGLNLVKEDNFCNYCRKFSSQEDLLKLKAAHQQASYFSNEYLQKRRRPDYF